MGVHVDDLFGHELSPLLSWSASSDRLDRGRGRSDCLDLRALVLDRPCSAFTDGIRIAKNRCGVLEGVCDVVQRQRRRLVSIAPSVGVDQRLVLLVSLQGAFQRRCRTRTRKERRCRRAD